MNLVPESAFVPALPWPWLVAVAVILVVARIVALQRVLAHRPSRTALLRWSGLTLALLCVLLAAARPGYDTGRDTALAVESGDTADLNVFVVVDRSPAAPVTEMRDDIGALIDRYPDARFALISFATRATLDWPLSDDVASLQSVVSGLSPYVPASEDPRAQANAFAARDVLFSKATSALTEYPGSRNLVFYLGTGTPESLVARGEFELPPGAVAGGAVLGYRYTDDGDTDEARLTQIAEQLGVPREVIPAPESIGAGATGEAVEVTDRRELYWVFAWLAAALLLIEVSFTVREYRRTTISRRGVRL